MRTEEPRARSGRFFRIVGIDVRVHWSFLLLLGWIFATHVLSGHGLTTALLGVGLTATIFACVVLHEFGHALTARHFGVRTRDITLYPIGGVARLERIPRQPSQELLISLAGPAVNLAIAGVLWLLVGHMPDPAKLEIIGGSFLGKLMYVNLSIGLFNLLPAFPMDGGRVLRALLAMRMDYVRATQIAATAGKTLAVLLGLLGMFGNAFLVFIALFVFVAAQQEALLVQSRALLEGIPVVDAMVTKFATVDAAQPLSSVLALLLESEQQDFPVLSGGERPVGVLTRADVLRALASGLRDERVKDVMTQSCEVAEDSEMLNDALKRMQDAGCTSLAVVRHGSLVGLLTLEHVGRWLMLRGALANTRSRDSGSKPAPTMRILGQGHA